jgi:hypothetical protein
MIDQAAEFRLLGSIVDRPDTVLGYTEELFTDDRRRVFDAMRRAYLAHGELSTEGVERFYGGVLPNEVEMVRGAKAGAVIEHLTDLATRRQVVRRIEELNMMVNRPRIGREEFLKFLPLPPLVSKEDSSLTPGVTSFVSDLGRKRSGQYSFVRTGLPFLDHMLGGEWPRAALSIIIGQAGGGKTAIVVQSILNMARLGIPSLFVSLEMPRARIISRLVANIANVNGLKLRMGEITDEEQERVNAALEEIQALEEYIYIVDRPSMTVEDIIYQVRLHQELHGVEAFFVDYLTIVARKPSENTAEALGVICRQLRAVAIDLNIAGIVLAQQNRMHKGLNSVMGSSEAGQAADTVIEIEFDPSATTNDESRLARLVFHKNRDGPVGESSTIYRPAFLRFEG